MTMKDLPGWRGTRKAFVFKSTTAALRLVRDGKVATTAGPAGAINVYRARDGYYHGQFMRFCSVQDSIICASLAKLREWLGANLPKTGDHDRLAMP